MRARLNHYFTSKKCLLSKTYRVNTGCKQVSSCNMLIFVNVWSGTSFALLTLKYNKRSDLCQ